MPSVIVSAARTAIGKFGGALANVPAVDLGGRAIEAAMERAGISGDQVDYVIMPSRPACPTPCRRSRSTRSVSPD